MSHRAQARKVFDIELAALKAVRAQLDASFDRAVELTVETLRQHGKVMVHAKHEPVGLVDSQDLPKLKIM